MEKSQKTAEKLKETVRAKYRQISEQGAEYNARSCCGAGGESKKVYNIMTDDYSSLEGYSKEADLSLGCGLPTEFAHIKKGDTVIDLGSGAGNDCFVARHETGAEGKVLGIDFTEEMVTKARQNAEKLKLNNVEFRLGDIENMPVADAMADVVVSNCVLNLVPDKRRVFKEIFRVLKPGGHFSISDIVLEGELPAALKEDAEMYAGCVAGASQKEDYLGFIKEAGFSEIIIQKEKPIEIPDDILSQYLSEAEIADFNEGSVGIYSITVFAQKKGEQTKDSKPAITLVGSNDAAACTPDSGCC